MPKGGGKWIIIKTQGWLKLNLDVKEDNSTCLKSDLK